MTYKVSSGTLSLYSLTNQPFLSVSDAVCRDHHSNPSYINNYRLQYFEHGFVYAVKTGQLV